MKKNGFGEGKWNGFGGKKKWYDWTLQRTAARELREESNLRVVSAGLTEVARIQFFEADTLLFDCAIFIVRQWRRIERETAEMRPQWFDLSAIPYQEMWDGDQLWIPLVLAGKKIDAVIRFKPGMDEVASFEYTERN
jgi:8-oxo-dGTP pyrophosphatase MutT (NUDIX family)